jgi:glycosyltransferase involved in cell wall biosynthesis
MSEQDTPGVPVGVDVAIPCYQHGRFLRDCAMSVLSQDIRDLRVLIIDNASTDNSPEVAQQLATEDSRIEVVAHQRNLGQHASFNEAIDWASSRYFLILCADDLLVPGSLARAASLMERKPEIHLTFGRVLTVMLDERLPFVSSNGQQVKWHVFRGRDLLERFCRTIRNHIHGPTAVVRTCVQKEVGYYRPELPHTDDFELWMRFARVGDAAETDALQGIQRNHQNTRTNVSLTNAYHWHLHYEAAFESFFTHEGAGVPDSKWLRRLARKNIARQAYWGGLSAFFCGQAGLSRDLLKLAFRLSPTTAILPPVSYLFRREDAIGRIISVASEAVGWSAPRGRAW